MRVEVAYSPAPRVVHRRTLELPEGTTLQAAVDASGLLDGVAAPAREALSFGVWGRVQPAEHVLRDRDRVEICRALVVDPKEARRLRYKRAAKRPSTG
jgi:putative ubiquitin-RnfH superfamily antitoxin RatB of RatAB toxin-antitoxin module